MIGAGIAKHLPSATVSKAEPESCFFFFFFFFSLISKRGCNWRCRGSGDVATGQKLLTILHIPATYSSVIADRRDVYAKGMVNSQRHYNCTPLLAGKEYESREILSCPHTGGWVRRKSERSAP